MLAGCLLSGGLCPCEPCALCSFRQGLHQLPSSIFPHHPSWTCGGEKPPIRSGVVKSERLRGHSSPGSWQQFPCHPSWGWLWKKPHGRCCLRHSWVCHPEPRRPSWRETRGTPFCGCAVPKKRRTHVSGIVHSHNLHCNARLLCDSSRRGHFPLQKGQKDSLTDLSHKLTK